MGLITDYKRIGFSRDLIHLFSGRLLLEFGINIFSLFLPIFLYQQYGENIQLVILYFICASLGYTIFIYWGARLMNVIGVKANMMISMVFRVVYYLSIFKLPDDPALYTVLALVSITFIRSLFWLPYHTEVARFTDKKHRGKQIGVYKSAAAVLQIIAPVIAGFILERWGFGFLAIISMVVALMSILPFSQMTKTQEEVTWTFGETIRYFFHPYNRRMVTAYMSHGLLNSVATVFWPVFIFLILDEKYDAVGLLTAAILIVGIAMRLSIGGLLDKIQKHRLVRVGTALNVTAWLVKAAVSSAFQIFMVSFYHTLGLIVLNTSVDTLVYEKAADSGHYADEYTLIKEMAIHFGKVVGLLIIAGLLIVFPIQISFIMAAIASMALIMLR